jgi:Sulfotransferase domain
MLESSNALLTGRRPDFFIVGAPKCGTTAMAEYLRQHPQIFMPMAKELHYFGSDLAYFRRRPTPEEYMACFADAAEARRVGEASVGYLYSEHAPAEILAFSPQASVIVMLRDPLDAIPARHAQRLFVGEEDIEDLEAALAAEPERELGRRVPPACDIPYALRYVWTSRYASHVERYFEAFGRERVHVILYDELRDDTAAAYRETLRFLGCDPNFVPQFPVVNARKRARSRTFQRLIRTPPQPIRSFGFRLLSRPARVRLRRFLYRYNSQPIKPQPMPPELRARLRDELRPDVERLGRVLQRDLSHWLQA